MIVGLDRGFFVSLSLLMIVGYVDDLANGCWLLDFTHGSLFVGLGQWLLDLTDRSSLFVRLYRWLLDLTDGSLFVGLGQWLFVGLGHW